jgi:hypothetical protein
MRLVCETSRDSRPGAVTTDDYESEGAGHELLQTPSPSASRPVSSAPGRKGSVSDVHA